MYHVYEKYKYCTSTSERRPRKDAQYMGVYTMLDKPASKKVSVIWYIKFEYYNEEVSFEISRIQSGSEILK